MSKTRRILEYALAMEKKGASFYREQANMVQNEDAKKLFKRLSFFEDEHVNYIQGKIDELEKEKEISFDPEEVAEENFIFETRKKEEIKDGAENDFPIIRMAYLIEKDFHDFYKKASEKAEEEQARNLFSELALWEKKHLEYLYKIYQDMMQEFWHDMGFEPF